MIKMEVKTERPYEILIGKGILSEAGKEISKVKAPGRAALVTDSNVSPLYAGQVTDSLTEAGFDVKLIEFPAGEENKNLGSYGEILEEMARSGLTRSDIVIALGGGVTGDMAGFAAATYMRGIPYVQIPTTYLASCDSSVGGKTAVDLPSGKNLCGAFWQPSLVICDPQVFRTLSPSEFLDGSAEAYKSAMIGDPELMEHVVSAMGEIDPSADIQDSLSDEFEYVIEHAVAVKKEIVEEDEHESGKRKLLNFGHTVGHAIEKLSDYATPHGHAVARGMVAESKAAFALGLTSYDASGKIEEDLVKMGFDTDIPYEAEALAKAAARDKKAGSSGISVIVPDAPGDLSVKDIPLADLEEYMKAGL